MEGSFPAGLVEDMDEDVAHEADALAYALLFDLVGGCFEGPVDEHGAAYDVFAGDEAPEAAIEAFGTVVAHGEDASGGDDEIVALDEAGKIVGPTGGDLVAGRRGNAGEVVAIGVEGVLRVAVVFGFASVGLVLRDAVEVDDAVAQVEVVAGDADDALDEVEIRGFGVGLEEDDDVAAFDLAVEDEGRPFCWGGEGDAVDENVIADEQGLLHGGGGNLEVLEDEGHDEETDGEDGADRGERFERGLGAVLLGGLGFVWYSFHRIGQNGISTRVLVSVSLMAGGAVRIFVLVGWVGPAEAIAKSLCRSGKA
jgi:hypothetical protein